MRPTPLFLAMGPWTGEVEGWLGVPVPVSPLKGQILRMEVEGPPMQCSVHYNSNYVGPKADGLVWAGTTEERVGFNNEPTEEARETILKEVGAFFPAVTSGKVVRQTACLRPVAPDGLPVIGQVTGWDGVYLSTGGWSQGDYPQPVHGQADGGHGAGTRRRCGGLPTGAVCVVASPGISC